MKYLEYDPSRDPHDKCVHDRCNFYGATPSYKFALCGLTVAASLRDGTHTLVGADDLPEDPQDPALRDVADSLDSRGQQRLRTAVRALLGKTV